tara:strand:+ start:41 stop:1129 length:1089 start_codon:yes stop_codon:yes gene_type:complete
MAYSVVGSCRFFINIIEWLEVVGQGFTNIGGDPDLHLTLPVVPRQVSFNMAGLPAQAMSAFNYDGSSNNFIAILGHNLSSTIEGAGTGCGISMIMSSSPAINLTTQITDDIVINNCNWADNSKTVSDGFSIVSFNSGGVGTEFYVYGTTGETGGTFNFNAGSIIIGTYYEMKNAPNLSLTMSRDYGSTKEITTYNGSTVSNTMWSSPPKWGYLAPWELNTGWSAAQMTHPDSLYSSYYNHNLARSGRRTWKLKFSFMDDGDLWGPNQSFSNTLWGDLSALFGDDPDDDLDIYGLFRGNILTDDNFFSQVWHKTAGGTLPFIFQPNKDDNTEFAICRFKNSTLKATQSAFHVYDIAVDIEEVW